MNHKERAQEHVAKALCYEASRPYCHHCQDGGCTIWYTFMSEAAAAIEATRDYYQLSARSKVRNG